MEEKLFLLMESLHLVLCCVIWHFQSGKIVKQGFGLKYSVGIKSFPCNDRNIVSSCPTLLSQMAQLSFAANGRVLQSHEQYDKRLIIFACTS
jgi:hypothetical protein